MPTLILILVIILIVYLLSKSNKLNVRGNTDDRKYQRNEEDINKEFINNILKNVKIEVTTSYTATMHKDNSVLDVTGQDLRLNNDTYLVTYTNGVPYWAHQYIYFYSAINGASSEQRSFYNIFKERFLNNEYLDLQGNTNYAFILLFDLLNDFDNHRDLGKLEKQLFTLGQNYPKTKPYGVSLLITKMEEYGDYDGVSRLRSQSNYNPSANYYEPDYWKIGSKYKTRLNLKDDEVSLLNKLSNPYNNFYNIEFCCLEILKLFIATIEGLNIKYIEEGQTLDQQFDVIGDLVARKNFRYRVGSANYKFCIESTRNEIYTTIFRYCENSVREHYGHKRKINVNINYSSDTLKSEYETIVISKVKEILSRLVTNIIPPDEATNIELNAQNTSRWKINFKDITINYKDNPKQFIEHILSLGDLNKKNPSIEMIFFEASKFIAKYDKESALILYIHYLYHDLKSVTFDNRQLTKTIQKSLFKTNEQIHNFEKVVSEFIKDKNLDKAIKGATSIYSVKRKKIKLNTMSIEEVKKQHAGTVVLLNEYLKDEYEDENNYIRTHELNNEELEIEITPRNENPSNSLDTWIIAFTPMQATFLENFAKNSFSIPQSDLEIFAKSKGVFINQLIESINDISYDILEDVLIEEDEEYYIINPNYFQRLLKND